MYFSVVMGIVLYYNSHVKIYNKSLPYLQYLQVHYIDVDILGKINFQESDVPCTGTELQQW